MLMKPAYMWRDRLEVVVCALKCKWFHSFFLATSEKFENTESYVTLKASTQNKVCCSTKQSKASHCSSIGRDYQQPCTGSVWHKRYRTESEEKDFIKLLRLATSSVEFSANGQMYKQLDGVAIGSPLWPTLANIFLGYREAVLLEKMSRPLF